MSEVVNENKQTFGEKIKDNAEVFSVGSVKITTHTLIGLASGIGLGYLMFKPKGTA